MSTLDFDTPATVPPFVLQDTDPVIAVLDPDGNPNHVVEAADGFTVALSWELTGILAPLIVNTWHARLYAQPIGTGGFAGLLVDTTAITATPGGPGVVKYTATLPVSPAQANTMLDPQGDGVYQLVVVVSHVNVFNNRDTMAGFSETIVIDVRKP